MPIGRYSISGGTNYSCDQEGYYTSMHKDSGLSSTYSGYLQGSGELDGGSQKTARPPLQKLNCALHASGSEEGETSSYPNSPGNFSSRYAYYNSARARSPLPFFDPQQLPVISEIPTPQKQWPGRDHRGSPKCDDLQGSAPPPEDLYGRFSLVGYAKQNSDVNCKGLVRIGQQNVSESVFDRWLLRKFQNEV